MLDAKVIARREFAGAWEYLLDDAIFAAPAHPHWSGAALEAAARAHAEQNGLKLGQVAQPLRAALTGKASSPPLFEMLALLGREESLVRLRAYAA